MKQFEIELLGQTHKLYKLPDGINEFFVSNIDEYILCAQSNLETITMMCAVARDHFAECMNARKKKMYLYIRANMNEKATILKDLAKAEAIEEIQKEGTAEAQYKRYEDFKLVALERLNTYKKIKQN